MLFGGVDENDGADGFARIVGWFVKFDLDFSGVFVAHGFVIKYDKKQYKIKELYLTNMFLLILRIKEKKVFSNAFLITIAKTYQTGNKC